MLCTLAIRRTRPGEQDRYDLRITGKTALGPSGTGGQDTRTSQTAEDVRTTLHELGLSAEALVTAETVLSDPRLGDHFTPVAEDVQIPFATLEQADVFLFD